MTQYQGYLHCTHCGLWSYLRKDTAATCHLLWGAFPMHSWLVCPHMRAPGTGVLWSYKFCWAPINSTLHSFLLKAIGMGQHDLHGYNTPKEASSSGRPSQQGIEVIGTRHALTWYAA